MSWFTKAINVVSKGISKMEEYDSKMETLCLRAEKKMLSICGSEKQSLYVAVDETQQEIIEKVSVKTKTIKSYLRIWIKLIKLCIWLTRLSYRGIRIISKLLRLFVKALCFIRRRVEKEPITITIKQIKANLAVEKENENG